VLLLSVNDLTRDFELMGALVYQCSPHTGITQSLQISYQNLIKAQHRSLRDGEGGNVYNNNTHHHNHPSRVRPDRPVAASSNSLFKGLTSCLCPSGLQFSIIFGILLLLILVICRKEFDLYLFSFLSNFQLFQNFFIPSVVKWSVPCCYEKFHLG